MATPSIPPPPGSDTRMGTPPNGVGGGQDASPAPAQPDPQQQALTKAVMDIVASTRMIANAVPGAAPIARQINDLVQQLSKKIVASSQPTEVAAPPV